MVGQRAIKANEKAERRQALLDAALEIFHTTSYEHVTVAAIAAKTGLAKGTVYLYFKSKEELFLALCEQQLNDLFEAINAGLDAEPNSHSIARLLALLQHELQQRPLLLRLVAILHTQLERNVDADTGLAFRRRLATRLRETGARLETFLHFLRPGEGAALLMRINALIIGLQHLAEPAPVVRQALSHPGMEVFQIDLTQELVVSLRALLLGLAYEAQAQRVRDARAANTAQ